MNEYEKKLQAFRKQEKKKRFLNQCKSYLWHRPVSSISSLIHTGNAAPTKLSVENCPSTVSLLEESSSGSEFCDENPSVDTQADDVSEDDTQEPFNWLRFTSCVLLWICLYSYSIYIEFGAIFFILSCFYFIWTNTRTQPKKANELSAYSVFNPNCEPIEGTVDAKQLESEMIYGMMF